LLKDRKYDKVVGILCAKVDMENVFNSNAEYVE
jgi:hypothetical protein